MEAVPCAFWQWSALTPTHAPQYLALGQQKAMFGLRFGLRARSQRPGSQPTTKQATSLSVLRLFWLLFFLVLLLQESLELS